MQRIDTDPEEFVNVMIVGVQASSAIEDTVNTVHDNALDLLDELKVSDANKARAAQQHLLRE